MDPARTTTAQRGVGSPPIDRVLCESLAREFQVPSWQVEAIYREELEKLTDGARISTFVGVLAARRVRARLRR